MSLGHYACLCCYGELCNGVVLHCFLSKSAIVFRCCFVRVCVCVYVVVVVVVVVLCVCVCVFCWLICLFSLVISLMMVNSIVTIYYFFNKKINCYFLLHIFQEPIWVCGRGWGGGRRGERGWQEEGDSEAEKGPLLSLPTRPDRAVTGVTSMMEIKV